MAELAVGRLTVLAILPHATAPDVPRWWRHSRSLEKMSRTTPSLVHSTLQALRSGERVVNGRPIVLVQTEKHLADRMFSRYTDVVRIDLHEVFNTGASRRGRAALSRKASVLLEESLPSDAVAICDTGEGWLGSSVARTLNRHSTVFSIGLQHGPMLIDGIITRPWIRRLRAATSDLSHRTLGGTPIGAGFGNSKFDGFVTFGPAYSEYVRFLYPGADVVSDFGFLAGDPELPSGSEFEIIFASQNLGHLLQEPEVVEAQVLDALQTLGESGWKVAYKPHPKGVHVDLSRTPAVAAVEGKISDAVSKDAIVVSYFSTVLFEAAFLGNPIVAVRPSFVPASYYAPFLNVISFDDFSRDWRGDTFSSISPDYITGKV